MEPGEARQRLLAEHDELRAALAHVVQLATRALAGTERSDELHASLQRCRELLDAHNESEARVLVPILQQDLAWGQARIDRMSEEHRAEHAEIQAALTGGDRDVAARMGDLKELVEAHMEAEERTFLSARVLRDDVVTVESSG